MKTCRNLLVVAILLFIDSAGAQLDSLKEKPASSAAEKAAATAGSSATTTIDAIKVLAWPVLALIALFVLRKPLSDLLVAIGSRARKITILPVTFEFAPLPELRPPWSSGP